MKIYSSLLLLLVCWGCNKNNGPVNFPEETELNLFNTSRTTLVRMSIDSFIPKNILLGFARGVALFNYDIYPESPPTSGIYMRDVYNYFSLQAGDHRFYFTDQYANLLTDSVLKLPAGSRHTLYVVDSLLQYKYFVLSNPRKTEKDNKTTFRILNLLPDATINTRAINSNGELLEQGLPQEIGFQKISPFQEVDAALAIEGSLYLRFFKPGNTTDVIGTATIPLYPGSAHTVVVYGYGEQHNLTYPDVPKDTILTAGIKSSVRRHW